MSVLKTTFKDLKSGLRQYLGDAIIKCAFGNKAILGNILHLTPLTRIYITRIYIYIHTLHLPLGRNLKMMNFCIYQAFQLS